MADSGSAMERVRFIAALGCRGATQVFGVSILLSEGERRPKFRQRGSAATQSGDKSHALHNAVATLVEHSTNAGLRRCG